MGGKVSDPTADPNNFIIMKTKKVNVFARENIGKAQNKALRLSGKLPGAIYDKAEATHVYFDIKELKTVLYSADTFILDLEIAGAEPIQAIVRETQFHPVTERPLHIDLVRVTNDRPVILELPVKLIGVPAGVAQGGKLATKLRFIKVKGIPAELPEYVEINVTKLGLGQTIKVGEANITNLEVITSAATGVASVEIPRALRSAGAAAEGTPAAPKK